MIYGSPLADDILRIPGLDLFLGEGFVRPIFPLRSSEVLVSGEEGPIWFTAAMVELFQLLLLPFFFLLDTFHLYWTVVLYTSLSHLSHTLALNNHQTIFYLIYLSTLFKRMTDPTMVLDLGLGFGDLYLRGIQFDLNILLLLDLIAFIHRYIRFRSCIIERGRRGIPRDRAEAYGTKNSKW
ncbi:hypothetical protein ACJX0J_031717 [Zea mays]